MINKEEDVKAVCIQCSNTGVCLTSEERFIEAYICDCKKNIEKPAPSKKLSTYMKTKSRSKILNQNFEIDRDLEEQESNFLKLDKNFNEKKMAIKKIDSLVQRINCAKIPSKFIDAKLDSIEIEGLKNWANSVFFEDNIDKSILITGDVGTGKTYSAIAILKHLINTHEKTAFYLSSQYYFSLLDTKNSLSFSSPERSNAQEELNLLQEIIREADILIFDEMGLQSISSESKKEKVFLEYYNIINQRYQSNKVTLYITNHTFEEKNSLQGETLPYKIGKRAASRLKESLLINIKRPDQRKSLHHSVEYEEINPEWTLPIIVAGKSSFIHWHVRTPLFETVQDQVRASLTIKNSNNGKLIDCDRPTPTVLNNIWNKGDSLIVTGPICDIDDYVCFLAMIQLLHKEHYIGKTGFQLITSLPNICRTIGKATTGNAKESVKRSLSRLARLRVEYSNESGDTWIGGLIDDVKYEGKKKTAKVIIDFNCNMSKFYKKGCFSSIDLSKICKLDSFGKKIVLFLESHNVSKKEISLERWKKILGSTKKSDTQFKKEINRSLRKMKSQKVVTFSSGIDKNILSLELL